MFIGTLFALGTLFVLQIPRTSLEAVLLDFAGAMALIVAIVPTEPDLTCGNPARLDPADVAAGVRNNISVFLVIGVVVAVNVFMIRRRTAPQEAKKREPWAKWAGRICSVVVIGQLALYLAFFKTFLGAAHGIAALTMVAAVIAVIVHSAVISTGNWRRWYFMLVISLGISAVVALTATALASGASHLILVAELIVLLHLSALILSQTFQFWQAPPYLLDGGELQATLPGD